MRISKLDKVAVRAEIKLPEVMEENPYLSRGIDTRGEQRTKGTVGVVID